MKIFNVPPQHVGEITVLVLVNNSRETIGGSTLPEWVVHLREKVFPFAVVGKDYEGFLILRMDWG